MTMRAPDSDLPIVLENVRHAARAVSILDGVSLTLLPGEPTVVIGPNGAGKTTLLSLAMGLIVPASGRVSWGGHPNHPPLRRAFVRQRPTMLRRSTAANIKYALANGATPRSDWPRRILELLDLVGLSGLGERPARRLSGGEQQRLALARALARDPQVLFLDEPTASLDPAATKAIEDLVCAIAARNIKVAMSTHDLGQARRLAGDIVFMHRGRVIETGAAAEFFANPRTEEARRFIAGELLV